MFDTEKFSGLLKANIVSVITPVLVLFVMSKHVDQNDYALFIGNYALVLVLATIVDFGSRQVFMLNDSIHLQNSADALKILLALAATVIYIVYTVYKGNDLVALFLAASLWKDVFIPIYKFKEDLAKYNRILFSSLLIISFGSLLVLFYQIVFFMYVAIFASVLPFLLFHRLNAIDLSITGVMGFVRLSGNFAVSNLLIGIGQNGSKILLLTVASPSVLVGFEVVTKIGNLGRYAINVVVEYIQLQKLNFSLGRLLGISTAIQLMGIAFLGVLAKYLEGYFEISAGLFLAQSLIYFPLVCIGYYHKVVSIKLEKTVVVLWSVALANLAFYLFLYCTKDIDLITVVVASVSVEYVILILTLIGIKK